MNDYWIENNIEKPPSYIVCAACKCEGIIIVSARHYDKLMHKQISQLPEGTWVKNKVVQGFIDQFGDFHTRHEALKIVQQNKQKIDIERNKCSKQLYSEGLY